MVNPVRYPEWNNWEWDFEKISWNNALYHKPEYGTLVDVRYKDKIQHAIYFNDQFCNHTLPEVMFWRYTPETYALLRSREYPKDI